MFLVLLRHSSDDLPLFLTADRTAAIEFAKAAPWEPPQEVCDVFRLDATTPCSICVVEFGTDGKPKKVIACRSYDDFAKPSVVLGSANDPTAT